MEGMFFFNMCYSIMHIFNILLFLVIEHIVKDLEADLVVLVVIVVADLGHDLLVIRSINQRKDIIQIYNNLILYLHFSDFYCKF